MTALVATLVALVAAVLGGFWVKARARKNAANAAADLGDQVVEQAKQIAKTKIEAAEKAATERLQTAEEKLREKIKVQAAASRLRDYLSTRRPRGGN